MYTYISIYTNTYKYTHIYRYERQISYFIVKLNTCHRTIKFDYKYSQNYIYFLDTTVYKSNDQNKLLTIVFCKPKDCKNFLHHKFAHPKPLIESIPYCQTLRLKKICTKIS